MSFKNDQDIVFKDLIISDFENFASKLNRFTEHGVSGLHFVFDFDRTLTVKNPGSNDEVTTWHIMKDQLPEKARSEYQSLFNKYRSIELASEMTNDLAVEWWSSILDLMVENKVSLTSVEETFLDRANIRPGTKELFDLTRELSVPTTILSAGILDIIDIWSRKYEVNPTLTLSTKLKVNDAGDVVGWDESSLIHVRNKKEIGHPELTSIRNKRPFTIVVGDSLDDADMAVGHEDVLRIRIIDRREDDPSLNDIMNSTFKHFDAMITGGSLHPIFNIVNRINRKS